MILITGATGTVGSEVVKQLATRQVRFRAMVHTPSKAAAVRLPGVEIVQGDFGDVASLTAALSSVDKVFLVSGPSPDQVRLENAVIDACARAGVQHLVKSSIFGADPEAEIPFLRWNGEIEGHLAQSGMAHTILRPNIFMQYVLQVTSSGLREGTLSFPVSEGRISLIDARDIGEVAAICLNQEGRRGHTYTLTGPEALTRHELADVLSAVLGRRVQSVSPSIEETRAQLIDMGSPDWAVEGSLAFVEYYARSEAADITADVQQVTGHSARTFRQFAEEVAKPFLQAEPPEAEEARRAA